MWLQEYSKLMFKQDNNKEDTKQAIQIKNKNIPKIVYKYREFSENSLNALKENYLIAAAPSYLNDPYEGSLYVDYEEHWKFVYQKFIKFIEKKLGIVINIDVNKIDDKKKIFSYIMDYLYIPLKDRLYWNNIWNEIDRLFKFKLKRFEIEIISISEDIYRICSFTEVNNSNTMWTHYGDTHRGFCLGYNLKELDNEITELLLPVRYNDEMIKVDEAIVDNSIPTNSSLLMNALTMKSLSWEYEKEWRVIQVALNKNKDQKISMPIPKEILLGLNIFDEHKEQILEIAKNKDINCYQMTRVSGRFNLMPIKIN